MDIKTAIETGDVHALRRVLTDNAALVDMPIHWHKEKDLESRPLHFICDKVCDKTITDERGEALARVLIEKGADINADDGDPLIAAASLGATRVALTLLNAGAGVGGRGPWNETALHWAAHTGNAVIVERLLEAGASPQARDSKFEGMPLDWALHGARDQPSPTHPETIALLRRHHRVSLLRRAWSKFSTTAIAGVLSFALFKSTEVKGPHATPDWWWLMLIAFILGGGAGLIAGGLAQLWKPARAVGKQIMLAGLGLWLGLIALLMFD